jgi:hypothetical protein
MRPRAGKAGSALLAVLLLALPGVASAQQRNAGAVQQREGYLPPAERSARLPVKGGHESVGVRAQAARYAACVVDKSRRRRASRSWPSRTRCRGETSSDWSIPNAWPGCRAWARR